MKLVVGLGNPGSKYRNTRHNVGFEILGRLAAQFEHSKPRARFEGEIIEAGHGETKIAMLCPLTYMNLSGRSVKAAISFYQIPADQVLIVCDDFNLDLGRIRIRNGGSSGGQNGLSDIIEKLGTDEVPRLRFGIGQPPPRWDVKNFVLSKFDKDDKEIADLALGRAVDAVQCWIKNGIQSAMNQFNSSPEKKEKQDNKQKTADKRKTVDQKKDQESKQAADNNNPVERSSRGIPEDE